MKKRMLSLLLALVMILGLLPTVALGASVVEDRRGYAHLIVENTTFTDASAASNNQPPAWKGQKITAGFPVTEGMTMMDAIVNPEGTERLADGRGKRLHQRDRRPEGI